jgi:hypothetical protein
VTIWATYIAAVNKAGIGHIPYCVNGTSIHPGRNGATHIVFHRDDPGSVEDAMLRTPLELPGEVGKEISRLMSLLAFLNSGFDLPDAKIMVCVKSVGPRKTIQQNKQREPLHLIEVGVFDETASCTLALWEDKIDSAKAWIPTHTTLLISSPFIRSRGTSSCGVDGSVQIGIGYSSTIDVDPDIPPARWLKRKVQAMCRRASTQAPFPADMWDVDLAMYGPVRTLHTIAEMEEHARDPETGAKFTGKLSLIIFEVNLLEQRRRGTMYRSEW